MKTIIIFFGVLLETLGLISEKLGIKSPSVVFAEYILGEES